jgi:hypothetical protein
MTIHDFEILRPHPTRNVAMVQPHTSRARAWLDHHVYDDAGLFKGLVLPEQCLPELMENILAAGLTIAGPWTSGRGGR